MLLKIMFYALGCILLWTCLFMFYACEPFTPRLQPNWGHMDTWDHFVIYSSYERWYIWLTRWGWLASYPFWNTIYFLIVEFMVVIDSVHDLIGFDVTSQGMLLWFWTQINLMIIVLYLFLLLVTLFLATLLNGA